MILNALIAKSDMKQEITVLKRQIEAIDRRIDELDYELYELSEEDIRLVEKRGLSSPENILGCD